MSNTGGWIDYNQFISEAFGWGTEISGPTNSTASNVVVGNNPPYSAADFLSVYPAFGGTPLVLTGELTLGSPVVSGLSSTAGILPGMIVAPSLTGVPGLFAPGTTVLSVDGDTQITLSSNALGIGQQVAIFNTPLLPVLVLNMYIALASASLVQARWCDAWPLAMAWYVNHFATLYLRSAGDVGCTAGELALAGLARGIQVSKSAGGVSVGIQPSTSGLESWGAWTETEAGVQLVTMARVMGAGLMWLY